MTSLKDINLAYNPFSIVPKRNSSDLYWAEMDDVKQKIERSYTDSINNNSKQLILNWGPYGGGKTFSAFYFLKEKKTINDLTQIYVRCPKDGPKAVNEFFKSIIDDLTFDVIHEHIQYLLEEHGETDFLKIITPLAGREYAKAIALLGSEDEDVIDAMNRFLYTGLTKTELKKLGLAKAIQTDADFLKFLTGLLSCFAGNDELYQGKLVIWIDEMEDLIYFAPKNYKSFSQILRDLFDNVSDGLLIFMNFTLAEGLESNIELILGSAVWSRITRKNRYKQFNAEQALQYTEELLNRAKVNKTIQNPLNISLLKSMINSIPEVNLTPREINKHMLSVLNFAIENDKTVIDINVFNEWMNSYAEDE